MELEIDVNRLKILEQQYIGERHTLQDNCFKQHPQKISNLENKIIKLDKDIAIRNSNSNLDFSMTLGKKVYTDKEKALNILTNAATNGQYADKTIGFYKGFEIIPLSRQDLFTQPRIALKGANTHIVELSDSESGNLTRIENVLKSLENTRVASVDKINDLKNQIETAQIQLEKPFEYETLLADSSKELIDINSELEIGKENIGNLVDEQEKDGEDLAKGYAEDEVLEETIIEEEIIEEDWELGM